MFRLSNLLTQIHIKIQHLHFVRKMLQCVKMIRSDENFPVFIFTVFVVKNINISLNGLETWRIKRK